MTHSLFTKDSKAIIWNNNAKAIQRMLGALDECKIEGIHTNIEYHKKILKKGAFINGDINTNFLNNLL